MKYSLRTKLSLSYIFVALMSVVILSLLSNIVLEKQFQSYLKKNIDKQNMDIVNQITEKYRDNIGWQYASIEDIGTRAISDGVIIRVEDHNGNIVWDALEHNHGLCQAMLQEMAQNMSTKYPQVKGSYKEDTYPIISSLNEVGKVYIGYYGPFYLNQSDLEFISALNRLLIIVGVIVFIIALVIGYYMANRLSKPISSTIRATHLISEGYYHNRINEDSNTKEVIDLIESVNHLAFTLEEQDQLRKQLTGDVAHELRTPIATLQSHMEAMIDGIWEINTDRLESCREEIIRIGRLVGDLEKLANYERGNLNLSKANFDISQAIIRILKMYENEFINKNIGIRFSETEVFVWADEDKICQVIVNLVSNALKYTAEGGQVEISLEDNLNTTTLTVKDNGIGIPKKDLPYVFERFYRADQSRNRLTGGSGIGLAIVKAIIEAHDGIVTIESELNVGTEVKVVIPKQQIKG